VVSGKRGVPKRGEIEIEGHGFARIITDWETTKGTKRGVLIKARGERLGARG
jgi:hypothetical protein